MTAEAAPLITRIIELETPDGPMPCYEAFPDGSGNRRGMIVIQEAFGVNNHIQEIARRLAAQGYHAVAPPSSIERGATRPSLTTASTKSRSTSWH